MIAEPFDPYSRIVDLPIYDQQLLEQWLKKLESCLTEKQKKNTRVVQITGGYISCTGFDLLHILAGKYCRICIGYDKVIGDVVVAWQGKSHTRYCNALRDTSPELAAEVLWPKEKP